MGRERRADRVLQWGVREESAVYYSGAGEKRGPCITVGRERREGRVLKWGVREERTVYYSGA